MNIRDDLKQLQTGDRDLRKFGLVVGGVFAALGVFFLLRNKGIYPYFLWPGVALMAFGVVWPRSLRQVYLGWMAVALVLGFVMAHVILTLFFFLVVMPIGLLARLFGKDFLSLKLDRAAKSYWIPREKRLKPAAEYERQF